MAQTPNHSGQVPGRKFFDGNFKCHLGVSCWVGALCYETPIKNHFHKENSRFIDVLRHTLSVFHFITLLKRFHPGQPPAADFRHEGVRIELLHIEHATPRPLSGKNHFCSQCRRYAGCVTDCLCSRFRVTLLVNASIINIIRRD